MFASIISYFRDLEYLLANPLVLIFAVFVVWMLVDAFRRSEWFWVLFIIIFPLLNAPLYYFLVYRHASPSFGARGFEFPGAQHRRRIKELETQIHHLDKAHHHLELGDIYFEQGKLDKAYASYQKAFERDPQDLDIRSHLGQCLLRMNRPREARTLLEQVCAEEPDHGYGHSLIALAEAHRSLQETDRAIEALQKVLQKHSYARARVQLAELYFEKNQPDLAKQELRDVISDDANAPDFQRKRERVWTRRAKALLRD